MSEQSIKPGVTVEWTSVQRKAGGTLRFTAREGRVLEVFGSGAVLVKLRNGRTDIIQRGDFQEKKDGQHHPLTRALPYSLTGEEETAS